MSSLVMTNQASARRQELLAGRYRLIVQVGKGGYGAVYRAADTLLHRRVAVKEISLRGVAPDQLTTVIETVKREVALLSRISHPHIPRLLDYFLVADAYYLVLEFVEGVTLADYVKQCGGQLPIDRVIDIGLQVCEMLEYLHLYASPAPIIFRDIKPENLMITASGQIYLIDFGIARYYDAQKSHDTFHLGSPGFAPPEQVDGRTSPQSDLYALGATLLTLLTGLDPLTVPPSLVRLGWQSYPVLADLEVLLLRLVDRYESRRPGSATEVRSQLQYCARSLSPLYWTVFGPQQAQPGQAAFHPAQQDSWQRYGLCRAGGQSAPSAPGPQGYTWSQAPAPRRRGNRRWRLPQLDSLAYGMGLLLGAVLIAYIGLFAGMALGAVLH
jgi:serine/threonine protein kinase